MQIKTAVVGVNKSRFISALLKNRFISALLKNMAILDINFLNILLKCCRIAIAVKRILEFFVLINQSVSVILMYMYIFLTCQAVHIGVRRLLNSGMFLSGTMTAAFGCIEFIPQTDTLAYTLTGFAIRTVQSAGCAAVFTTVFTLITDMFPQHNTLMLV